MQAELCPIKVWMPEGETHQSGKLSNCHTSFQLGAFLDIHVSFDGLVLLDQLQINAVVDCFVMAI